MRRKRKIRAERTGKLIGSFSIVTLIVAGSSLSTAQERAVQPGKKVILHAARLLDVKTGTTLSDQCGRRAGRSDVRFRARTEHHGRPLGICDEGRRGGKK
jgi:hypothetical protein